MADKMEVLKWFEDDSKVKMVDTYIPSMSDLKDEYVIIKVIYSGVCGSDLLVMQKKKDAINEVTLGHEISGIVHKIGKNVENLNIGDHVVVMPRGYCGKCRFCLRGLVKYCVKDLYCGFQIDGGWADYLQCAAYQVFKLPEGMSLKEGLLCQPFSCVAVGWDNNGDIQSDANILIMGMGIIGLLWATLFKHHGYNNVTILELSEGRKKIAQGLFDYEICHPDDIKEKFSKCNAVVDGFDLVVDCTGSIKAIQDAFYWLRKGGTLNIFGCCPVNSELTIDPSQIMLRELKIVGTIFDPFKFPAAVGLVRGMKKEYLEYERLGIAIYKLEAHEDAFHDLKCGKISKAVFHIGKQ